MTNRAKLRELRRANRIRRDAVKKARTGQATMREHLIAKGLDYRIADRFAGTVSRGMKTYATETIVVKKLKKNSRKTGTFPAYVYTSDMANKALATYVNKGGPRTDATAREAFFALV